MWTWLVISVFSQPFSQLTYRVLPANINPLPPKVLSTDVFCDCANGEAPLVSALACKNNIYQWCVNFEGGSGQNMLTSLLEGGNGLMTTDSVHMHGSDV